LIRLDQSVRVSVVRKSQDAGTNKTHNEQDKQLVIKYNKVFEMTELAIKNEKTRNLQGTRN